MMEYTVMTHGQVNVLLDEPLDHVWKTFYGKKREKYERIKD